MVNLSANSLRVFSSAGNVVESFCISVYSVQYLPKTWLDFTNENIKILGNKIEFKAELKKYLLSELSSIISCDPLLCPSCQLNA